MDIIGTLKDTPVPTVLVLGGLTFIFIAVVGRFAYQIDVPSDRQKIAAVVGVVLLLGGTVLSLAPSTPTTNSGVIVFNPSATPQPPPTSIPTSTNPPLPSDTAIPTPNFEATATQNALMNYATMTQFVQNLTSTSDAWTDTPTPISTFTDVPTMRATSTNTPGTSPPSAIEDVLKEIGIEPNNGRLVSQINTFALEGTVDDRVEWKDLNGIYTDFVIGATAHWQGGETIGECGFIFRKSDTANLYSISLVGQAYIAFARLDKNVWQAGHNSPWLTLKRDGSYELILTAFGDKFTMYVDRQRMADFQDGTFTDGSIGLSVISHKGEKVTCSFDDIWIWARD